MSLAAGLAEALVVSRHDRPQPSPQEWECGCVTAVYITDADALAGGRPFEMRLAVKCTSGRCAIRRMALDAVLHREDLLSSRDWPWTTAALLRAYNAAPDERQAP